MKYTFSFRFLIPPKIVNPQIYWVLLNTVAKKMKKILHFSIETWFLSPLTKKLFWNQNMNLLEQFMSIGVSMKPRLWWFLAQKQLFLSHETLLKKKKTTKTAWNHHETLSVSQKIKSIKHETTFGFKKKDNFPNRPLKSIFKGWY